MLDVPEEDGTPQLRDKAAKEAENKQRRIVRELRQRERLVSEDKDSVDDIGTLQHYTMKRVTEMRLSEAVDVARATYLGMLRKHLSTMLCIKELEADKPQHAGMWLDCYNTRRAETGMPKYVPGGDEFVKLQTSTIDGLRQRLDAVEQ